MHHHVPHKSIRLQSHCDRTNALQKRVMPITGLIVVVTIVIISAHGLQLVVVDVQMHRVTSLLVHMPLMNLPDRQLRHRRGSWAVLEVEPLLCLSIPQHPRLHIEIVLVRLVDSGTPKICQIAWALHANARQIRVHPSRTSDQQLHQIATVSLRHRRSLSSDNSTNMLPIGTDHRCALPSPRSTGASHRDVSSCAGKERSTVNLPRHLMQIHSILCHQLHLTLSTIGPVDLKTCTTLHSSIHHPETIPLALVHRMRWLVLSVHNHEILVASRTEQSITAMRSESSHMQQVDKLHEEGHLFHVSVRRWQSSLPILHHNHTRSTTTSLYRSSMMMVGMIPVCASHVIFRNLNVVLRGSPRLHVSEHIILSRLGRHVQPMGMQIRSVQIANVILLFHCKAAKTGDTDFLHDGVIITVRVRVLQTIVQSQANGVAWVHPHDGT
mmetsp:Transcript_41062/g.89509  ORF Transcript_41062/g.89509 Transcript_41062/m.89509 type:complete len:439 (+) Transcript_41062:320-1636(+)